MHWLIVDLLLSFVFLIPIYLYFQRDLYGCWIYSFIVSSIVILVIGLWNSYKDFKNEGEKI